MKAVLLFCLLVLGMAVLVSSQAGLAGGMGGGNSLFTLMALGGR